MPFKSEKQRKYLWANEPEIARDWSDKYGSRVKKQDGGVMDIINKYIGPSEGHMYDWGKALGAKNKPWSTTPEYHQWGAENLATHGAENWNNLFPGLGEAFKRTAPFIAGAASPIYDIPQGISRYHDKPWEYETNNKWDKINAYFPDLQGTTASGILNAIDKEDPLSAAYNRMIGAAQPWIKDKFINRPNQIQNLLKKGWGAIKNEFSGSAAAEEMTIEELRDYFEGLSPEDLGLPKRGEADWEKYMRGQIADVPRLSNEAWLAEADKRHLTASNPNVMKDFKYSTDKDEDDPYALTERLMRRGDFRRSSSYPSYNAWQMRAAQAPGWRRNAGRVMDFLRGPGTRLTPAQQQANQNFITQQRIKINPQGRMTSGPFVGQHAPGTSFFGSKTAEEQAAKNLARFPKSKNVKAWENIMGGGQSGKHERDPSGSTYTDPYDPGGGEKEGGLIRKAYGGRAGLASLWQR